MPLVESEALILRTYPLADADKIVVLLTEQQGLVRGVAKGARRLQSKFGGSLEPLSIATVEYFQKEDRELVGIRRIDLHKSFFSSAGNPTFFKKTSYLVDLLQNFAPPNEANVRLFGMAKICFETAAEKPENLDALIAYFEVWLLQLTGFLPNWEVCSLCGREIEESEDAFLLPDLRHVCTGCEKGNRNQRLSSQERQMHFAALRSSPSRYVESFGRTTESLGILSGFYKKIIAQILGREFMSEETLTASR